MSDIDEDIEKRGIQFKIDDPVTNETPKQENNTTNENNKTNEKEGDTTDQRNNDDKNISSSGSSSLTLNDSSLQTISENDIELLNKLPLSVGSEIFDSDNDENIGNRERLDKEVKEFFNDYNTNNKIKPEYLHNNRSDEKTRILQQYVDPPTSVGFRDVEIAVSEFYNKQQFYSSAFDIISTYIKGQKILYTEAHEYCTMYLNLLMLPAIFFSALASVLSFSFEDYSWGPFIVASLNAFNGFLLSVVSYSKLDAASEAHKITSHQYDKLQSMCEFTSGCLMVLPFDSEEEDEVDGSGNVILKTKMNDKRLDPNDLAREKLAIIENKIKDIKETNNFIIPTRIRNRFTNIYYINIFSLVKRINEAECKKIIDMKNLINMGKQLEYKMKINNITTKEYARFMRIHTLINKFHKDFIDLQGAYSDIDIMFKNVIRYAERERRRNALCRWICPLQRTPKQLTSYDSDSDIDDKYNNNGKTVNSNSNTKTKKKNKKRNNHYSTIQNEDDIIKKLNRIATGRDMRKITLHSTNIDKYFN